MVGDRTPKRRDGLIITSFTRAVLISPNTEISNGHLKDLSQICEPNLVQLERDISFVITYS